MNVMGFLIDSTWLLASISCFLSSGSSVVVVLTLLRVSKNINRVGNGDFQQVGQNKQLVLSKSSILEEDRAFKKALFCLSFILPTRLKRLAVRHDFQQGKCREVLLCIPVILKLQLSSEFEIFILFAPLLLGIWLLMIRFCLESCIDVLLYLFSLKAKASFMK